MLSKEPRRRGEPEVIFEPCNNAPESPLWVAKLGKACPGWSAEKQQKKLRARGVEPVPFRGNAGEIVLGHGVDPVDGVVRTESTQRVSVNQRPRLLKVGAR